MALAFVSLSACASKVKEVHYFKSEDKEGNPINYYRLTVTGGTALASARYVSGYFDEAAVDTYFGPIKRAQGGDQFPPPSAGRTVSLDPSLEGKKLVLLLSSDSNTIAAQISAIAQNEVIIADLINLLNRSKVQELQLEIEEAGGSGAATKATALVALGDSLIKGLKDDASKEEVEANMVAYLNRLAAELGDSVNFSSLTEARTWVQVNRARFLN